MSLCSTYLLIIVYVSLQLFEDKDSKWIDELNNKLE